MECPKCHHIQNENKVCEKCGIIFEKYNASINRVKNTSLNSKSSSYSIPYKKKVKPLTYAINFLMVIFVCLVIYLLFSNLKDKKNNVKTINITNNKSETKKQNKQIATTSNNFQQTEIKKQKSEKITGLKKQLYNYYKPQNQIEKAQLATVFIKSPWGIGSGFFIDNSGHIITNKHVVVLDEKVKKDIQLQMDLYKDLIEKQKKKIEGAKEYLSTLTDSHLIYDLETKIEDAEKQVEKMQDEYDKLDNLYFEMKYSSRFTEYKIILYDKSEFTVKGAKVSKNHDLALIKLDVENSPFIPMGNPHNIRPGLPVFTIGNPVGLSFTITSGIVSGLRSNKGNKLIQTDAPINPGNSGGPLIDKEGHVLGVNTMIIQNTEGIGFAIPIETVKQSFDIF